MTSFLYWIFAVVIVTNIQTTDLDVLSENLPSNTRAEYHQGYTLIVFDDALFGTDEYHLTERSKAISDQVGQVLNDKLPSRWLWVEGHTDSEGTEEYNLSLSELRANAVATRILKSGYQVERVDTIGYGFKYPLCDNSTREGRACNRRVQIAVFKTRRKK